METSLYDIVWKGDTWRESEPVRPPSEPLSDMPSSTKALGAICEHAILDALKHGYRTRSMLLRSLRPHSPSGVHAALQRLKRRKVIASRVVYIASWERMGIVWGLAGAPPPVNERPVVTEKRCRGACRQIKPLEEYGVNQALPDKHARICKVCIGEYNRRYKKVRRPATSQIEAA